MRPTTRDRATHRYCAVPRLWLTMPFRSCQSSGSILLFVTTPVMTPVASPQKCVTAKVRKNRTLLAIICFTSSSVMRSLQAGSRGRHQFRPDQNYAEGDYAGNDEEPLICFMLCPPHGIPDLRAEAAIACAAAWRILRSRVRQSRQASQGPASGRETRVRLPEPPATSSQQGA